MPLTDQQWLLVSDLFPGSPSVLISHAGRPALDRRTVLDGILWKLTSRHPWHDIPACFGSHQVCYLYYRQWLHSGLLRRIIIALLADVEDRGDFDLAAACITHRVRLDWVGNRIQVYVLPSLASTWQFQTALLYYQFVASQVEHQRFGSSRSPDPLERIFDKHNAE